MASAPLVADLTAFWLWQTVSGMKRGGISKAILLVGLVSVIGYFPLFHWIERQRTIKGPWTVDFADAGGKASLVINQPKLGITNITLVVPSITAGTNGGRRIEFSVASPVPYQIPYGRCVFQDTIFLPGTIVVEIGGHEIQLLPRVLTIDKQERAWRNGEQIEIR